MRYVKLDKEQMNVPVLKNVKYAVSLVWKADKRLIIGYLMQNVFDDVFSTFIRNILFLKVLLDIISGSGDFKAYATALVIFAVTAIISKVISWSGMRIEKEATKTY